MLIRIENDLIACWRVREQTHQKTIKYCINGFLQAQEKRKPELGYNSGQGNAICDGHFHIPKSNKKTENCILDTLPVKGKYVSPQCPKSLHNSQPSILLSITKFRRT